MPDKAADGRIGGGAGMMTNDVAVGVAVGVIAWVIVVFAIGA
ncbi:MAG: hypothetical protein ACRESR_06200 [Gammaproteobacteria bacterium]